MCVENSLQVQFETETLSPVQLDLVERLAA
jgi:hypothetical protein